MIFGPSYAGGFAGLLAGRTLVVLDQRGTGGSSALDCPEVQGLDSLETLYPADVAGCAERIGPGRDSFASVDTADDVEAVRRRLGVPKLAIYGVSYGTWAAQQYARRYPDRVERLILDSPVSPAYDPWDTKIVRALPRVLAGLCAGAACAGITRDPMADLTAVVRRIQRQGRPAAIVRTPTGGRMRADLSEFGLLAILVGSDLNPYMRSRIPAALAAARAADYAPLIRLERDAAGPLTPLSQFSAGLFVTTTCLDNALPYSYADPLQDRRARAAAALAQLPPGAFAPFSRVTIDVSSVPDICLQWPDGVRRRPSSAPLPDVPTLILSGLEDLRTPLEGARELAAEIPRAQLVTLKGSGHDVLDTDVTGCVAAAVGRFLRGRPVGQPCRRRSASRRMALVPPRSLAAVAPVPGLGVRRGRVLRATLASIADASASDNEAYYAGFADTSGGGLRGGRYESLPTRLGQVLVLRGLEYVPGVRVSGSVLVDGRRVAGSVRVAARGAPSGRVAFFGGRVVARLRGVTLKTTIGHLLRTRLARAAERPAFRAALRR